MFCYTKAQRDDVSVIDFAYHSTSPGVKTCRAYIAHLNNDASNFWLPFTGVAGWTSEGRKMAFQAAWCLIGDLYLRVVAPFLGWPWRLAILVNDAASMAEKRQAAQDFLQAPPCCLDGGFLLKVKRMARDIDGLLSHRMVTFLREVYQQCRFNNVKVETQFARQRKQHASCFGRLPSASTMASKHFLSELFSLHQKFMQAHPDPACADLSLVRPLHAACRVCHKRSTCGEGDT